MGDEYLLYVEETPWAFGGSRRPLEQSEYFLFGAPFDSTASYRTGQRWGPEAIRRASAFIEFYSLRAGFDVDEIPVADVGDVAVVYGDARATVSRVERVVEALASTGRIPVMLGGEHTVTLGAVRGLARAGRLPCLVVFDAHFDLRSEYAGLRLSHATVMRRIIEEVGPERVVYVGVRGFAQEELDYARRRGEVKFYTVRDVMIMGEVNVAASIRKDLKDCRHVYVTVDIDVLDPAYAPGVGNPEPEGFTTFTLYEIIHGVVDGRLAGFDVVEVSPPHDCGGVTAAAAAKTVVEVVAAREAARRRRPS
ncbi:agmatinase [Stetteria hydrogenophila]